MRVAATGGTPELVIPAADGELLAAPQLLPDGDVVLFSLTTGSSFGDPSLWNDAQIVAQSLTSGERTVLLEGGSDARYVSTGHLVYALDDGLFAVAFDAGNRTVMGGPVSLVQGVVRATAAASANYAVSDDGTLFYLTGSQVSGRPLVWVDRASRGEVIETIPPGQYTTPRLSRDDDRVLVVADGDARIYDIASGRESRLTTDRATQVYADWTPSDAAVTYSSTRGSDGGMNVWIQPADGSGPARQLTTLDEQVHFDSWAPDGRTFSAHHHIGGAVNQLMVPFDEADAEPDVWLEREFIDSNAVFAPDGRYVAYVSAPTGQTEIYIRPFPGPGGETPVSVGRGRTSVGTQRRAVLSAGGRLRNDGGRGLDRSSVDGGPPHRAVRGRRSCGLRRTAGPVCGDARRPTVSDERGRVGIGRHGIRRRRRPEGHRRPALGRRAQGASAHPIAMPLHPGTTLGPYQVIAKLGEGGMGELWQARDTTLDRDVALKVLPEVFTSDLDRLARFEREAKARAE